jgi:hypothetical protein
MLDSAQLRARIDAQLESEHAAFQAIWGGLECLDHLEAS